MTHTKDEALNMALEALEKHGEAPNDWACKECVPFSDILKDGFQCKYHEAITAIKQALAAPVQEPVAKYIGECSDGSLVQLYEDVKKGTDFYTTPPAQPAPVQPVSGVVLRDGLPTLLQDKHIKETDQRLCIIPPAQPAPVQEPVAWPCVIAEADFEKKTITLEMQCSDYKVGAGQHWLHTTPPAAKRPWTGLTDAEKQWIRITEWTVDELIEWVNTKLKGKNT